MHLTRLRRASVQWLRCPAKLDDPSIIISKVGLDLVLNAHVLRVRSALKPNRRLALGRNLLFLRLL